MPERQHSIPHIRVVCFICETQIFLGLHHSLYQSSPIAGAGESEQEITIVSPPPSGAESSAASAATATICPVWAEVEHGRPILPGAFKIGGGDNGIELDGIFVGQIRRSHKSDNKEKPDASQCANTVEWPGSKSAPDLNKAENRGAQEQERGGEVAQRQGGANHEKMQTIHRLGRRRADFQLVKDRVTEFHCAVGRDRSKAKARVEILRRVHRGQGAQPQALVPQRARLRNRALS